MGYFKLIHGVEVPSKINVPLVSKTNGTINLKPYFQASSPLIDAQRYHPYHFNSWQIPL